MSIRRAASAVLATMALFASGCDTVKRPPGITCEKLRALKVGNTRDEVRNVLGPPRWEGAEHPNYEKPEWDYTWAYSSKQVRLFVNFLDDRLVMVSSYIRTFLREMTGRYDGGRPTLFWLYKDNRREGEEFTRIYCPQ